MSQQPEEKPEGSNDLGRPVQPPSGVRRVAGGERHLTRRVVAPAALLLISIPVVLLLLLNLRAVGGGDDPAPGSASSTPSASASADPSQGPTARVGALSTTSAPAAGGTVLTVTGTDLGSVTQVLFGPLNGLDLRHVSDTELQITTPAGAPGEVPVTFKVGAEDAASAVAEFTYT